jgi:GDSL-like Lipase/Acylhydrolase family
LRAPVATVLVVLLSSVLLTADASALERPGSVELAWEGQAGPWSDGLYVIGDSISLFVPYGETGEALGVHTWWRAGLGWTTHSHRHQRWGASGLPSFTDAARSPAHTVFVQLGTNDTNCFRRAGLCGDVPRTRAERDAEWARIELEVTAAARQLLDADKCVVWAGPREIGRAGAGIEQPRRFNRLLRALEARNPGRFVYLDYSHHSFTDPALRDSLVGDGIHPQTPEGRQVLANLAFWYARAGCHLP